MLPSLSLHPPRRQRLGKPSAFALTTARRAAAAVAPVLLPPLSPQQQALNARWIGHLTEETRRSTQWIRRRTNGPHADHGVLRPGEAELVVPILVGLGISWASADHDDALPTDDVAQVIGQDLAVRRLGVIQDGIFRLSAWRAVLWQRRPELIFPDPFLVARLARDLQAFLHQEGQCMVRMGTVGKRHPVRITALTTRGRIGSFIANLAC
jgi:hypothetical protein